jgi:hypothetical protein
MLFWCQNPLSPLFKGQASRNSPLKSGGGGFGFIHFPVSLFILSFLLTACFETIAPDVGPRGTLRFKSNQKDAVLEVDETRLGPIGKFEQSGVLLHPGEHRIVVSQKGYFKEYRLITVVKDQLQTVEVNLTPVPD